MAGGVVLFSRSLGVLAKQKIRVNVIVGQIRDKILIMVLEANRKLWSLQKC